MVTDVLSCVMIVAIIAWGYYAIGVLNVGNKELSSDEVKQLIVLTIAAIILPALFGLDILHYIEEDEYLAEKSQEFLSLFFFVPILCDMLIFSNASSYREESKKTKETEQC